MRKLVGLWCIYCMHVGQQHKDNGRHCIRCLRNTIMISNGDVEEPLFYEEVE